MSWVEAPCCKGLHSIDRSQRGEKVVSRVQTRCQFAGDVDAVESVGGVANGDPNFRSLGQSTDVMNPS